MSDGYEQIYERLLPALGACDFPEVAERLGMSLQPGGALAVTFLGREYEISASGVEAKDGKPVQVNNRSVLAYYTLSRGAGEPAGAFVPLSHLTCSLIVSSNTQWMTDPLGQAFCGEFPSFEETMRRLGAVFASKLESGRYVWTLQVLPKIILQIAYYDRDAEFPCAVQILFDANASRFMEFECLAFLQGCLVRAMLMTAQNGDTTGWV
ncbi:MAG: DUF3786 domain-containing protein [Desulfobulbaceae bacterium]|nr:DUF3786 domain-containing protein [Desulfobulbaceae bacterium]